MRAWERCEVGWLDLRLEVGEAVRDGVQAVVGEVDVNALVVWREEVRGDVGDAVVGEVEALEGGRLLEKIFRHGSYTVVC